MSEHYDIGKAGEETARQYLIEKGYKILALNWHFNKKEIDIVAQQTDEIVFVEVKTRSTLAFERPQEAVTIKKQKFIITAADAYLNQYNINNNSRFDIISVLNGPPPKVIEHIEGAFTAMDIM